MAARTPWPTCAERASIATRCARTVCCPDTARPCTRSSDRHGPTSAWPCSPCSAVTASLSASTVCCATCARHNPKRPTGCASPPRWHGTARPAHWPRAPSRWTYGWCARCHAPAAIPTCWPNGWRWTTMCTSSRHRPIPRSLSTSRRRSTGRRSNGTRCISHSRPWTPGSPPDDNASPLSDSAATLRPLGRDGAPLF